MPVFHALTENDTVSHLVVEERKLPGTLGKVFPKSLKHSKSIMEIPSVIEDDVLCTCTTGAVCRAAA